MYDDAEPPCGCHPGCVLQQEWALAEARRGIDGVGRLLEHRYWRVTLLKPRKGEQPVHLLLAPTKFLCPYDAMQYLHTGRLGAHWDPLLSQFAQSMTAHPEWVKRGDEPAPAFIHPIRDLELCIHLSACRHCST